VYNHFREGLPESKLWERIKEFMILFFIREEEEVLAELLLCQARAHEK
jgi:hypothetical protein